MRAPGSRPDAAVVVGGFVNGLGIVRSLADRGRRVAIITTKPFDIAQHSRGVDGREHLDHLDEDPDSLADLLARRAPDWSGRVVFPTNDEALESLSMHRERLSRWYRIVIPPADSVPFLLDKRRMWEAAEAVGMSVPVRYGPANPETAARDGIVYPVVVKPDAGHVFSSRMGVKLLTAASREELLDRVSVFADAGLDGHVFDLIPGDDHHIYCYCVYVDGHGDPSRGVTVRKIRQSPASFGVARVAELADRADRLREPTVELLRRIGFRGIAVAEFKLDPRDGTFRFMEINGRSMIYNGLVRKGGMDLAGLAWSDYVTGRVDQVEPTHWDGVWIHLHADILRATFDRRREQDGFREFARVYRRRKTYAVWSASDPRPFLAQWARTARAAPHRLLGGSGTGG